ncbi:MAG TPA: hypothetical protein VM939_02645 [Gemmatimonadaceae bacterium]|nr:hypothetical protein [Gemmatimonadaceae bacterium]
MHISFAVFADGANLSQEGKLNVLGVFDALQVGGFPSMHPRTHFVVRLKGSTEDTGSHTLTFNWVNPAGETLWSSDGELNVTPGPNPAFEMDLPIIAVIDLPLNLPGLYEMRVALDGNPTAEVRLFVTGAPPVVMQPPNGLVS